MGKRYGLDRMSQQIMELLWSAAEPVAYEEILLLARPGWRKKQKLRRLHRCLTRLRKKGIVTENNAQSGRTYCAVYGKEEFIKKWTKEQVRRCFRSLRMPQCFPMEGGLTEEEADELMRLL